MADISATHSKGKDDWETPWWLIHLVEKEFGEIDLDPCCTFSSRKGAQYFTESDNGLEQPWFGTVFVNPPYSKMSFWAAKAYQEAKAGNTRNILFLCAARTDTRAWWDYLRHGEVRFIKGRVKFKDPNMGSECKAVGAPFPSSLVVFPRNMWKSPSTVYWDIPVKERQED